MTSLRSIASLLCFLPLAAACGDDTDTTPPTGGAGGAGGSAGGAGGAGGGDGGTGGGPPPACARLEALDTMVDVYSFAPTGLAAMVNAPLPGYAKTRLTLELYPPADANLGPGSFDLSAPPDDSYATCEHCVLLVAYDELGQARRAFFQDSGSMQITEYDPLEPWVIVGSVEGAHLVEVTQNPDLSWSVVPDGLCYDVDDWAFDTRVVDGAPCTRAEDCPNELFQICDVASHTCQAMQCDVFGDFPCAGDERCMVQYGLLIDHDESGPAGGACYSTCVPGFSNECPSGETCFPLDATQESGICLAVGGPAIGQSCTPSDIGTGCAAGGLCTGEPPQCLAICEYLSADVDCPTGTYCSKLNLCEPLSVGDTAPVNAVCDDDAPYLADCGPEGSSFRGVCFQVFPSEDPICRRICETAHPDCPAGEECLGVFTNASVGACMDPGACGDGAVDLYTGELCDDGNQVSGDGCSADCKTPELAPLCGLASTLDPNDVVIGTTAGGPTGYPSGCDPFVATPVASYAFTPPAPGELTLTLSSVFPLELSLLEDCVATAELGCRSVEHETAKLHIDFAEVPAEPTLVVVRGATPVDAGSFILQSEFVVASCGDGYVAGPEACDDGNQVSGDGCSADCAAIEWPELCAALPTLQSGSVESSSVDGGTESFDLTGVCAFDSGKERAYSFIAPSAGTLNVSLVSDANLVLFVRDGCGPVDDATYLSCSNFAQAGETEQTSVSLSAGQAITVVVDGFTQDDAGAYTLTALFTP
ncbi:MAG: DUF4215 domain-containing protein [Polyangiaceae bacterium]